MIINLHFPAHCRDVTGAGPLPAPARDNYLAVVWRDERRPEEMCPQPSQPSPAQPSLRTQFIVQKLNAGGIFFLQLCAAEQKGNKLKGSGKLFEWKLLNFLQLLAATSLLPVEARLPWRGNMLRYTLWVERLQCSSALCTSHCTMGLITAPSDARTAGTLTQTLQLSAATADMSQCPWYTAGAWAGPGPDDDSPA